MKYRLMFAAAMAVVCSPTWSTDSSCEFSTQVHALKQLREGRDAFRYATFGDEVFWGDGIGLHLALAGAANGGTGPGVSPATALAAGLKVDVDALPRSVLRAITRGKADLDDPAVTLERPTGVIAPRRCADCGRTPPAGSITTAVFPRWRRSSTTTTHTSR
jgi:hypothetical protein